MLPSSGCPHLALVRLDLVQLRPEVHVSILTIPNQSRKPITHFNCFEKSSLVSSSSQLSSHKCVDPPSPGTSCSSAGQSKHNLKRQPSHSINVLPYVMVERILVCCSVKGLCMVWYLRRGNPRIHHLPRERRRGFVRLSLLWREGRRLRLWWSGRNRLLMRTL